ncbi:hypothetical protein MAP00_007621 [Monascus purpureus]|nr:hypothetical protein MAP00_007621 [Monascus purpureus]
MRLAKAIDHQHSGDIEPGQQSPYGMSNLVTDLQKCHMENVQLMDMVHYQQGLLENQSHQISVLSQAVAAGGREVDQKIVEPTRANMHTPLPGGAYKPRTFSVSSS